MRNDVIPDVEALRLLGQVWLSRLEANDIALLAARPELVEALPKTDSAALADLAAEHQRLFGFNLPPYESVFVDPSAAVSAPATELVQALYQQAGWRAPPEVQVEAVDHLGLELLALADWWERGQTDLARQLLLRHLALWAPAFVLSLRRLRPHSFYDLLGNLTLERLLTGLPPDPISPDDDPFPVLARPSASSAEEDELAIALGDVVTRLLTPRETGLFLMREDIIHLNYAVGLPEAKGERRQMLATLFREAHQRQRMPALLKGLHEILTDTEAVYRRWAEEYPNWARYARVWYHHVLSTRTTLNLLEAVLIDDRD